VITSFSPTKKEQPEAEEGEKGESPVDRRSWVPGGKNSERGLMKIILPLASLFYSHEKVKRDL